VARIDEELAGYLRVIPMTGPPPLVRIGRVAVSPSLRRCGIGRMLMEKALASCREAFCYSQSHSAPSSFYYPASREEKDMVDDTNLHQFMGQIF
jgi:predicted GNAT family N-acyltransferase